MLLGELERRTPVWSRASGVSTMAAFRVIGGVKAGLSVRTMGASPSFGASIARRAPGTPLSEAVSGALVDRLHPARHEVHQQVVAQVGGTSEVGLAAAHR